MAAGNAARFGENKLAATVNGKPLIEHALDAIPRESFSRVLVVTQHENVEAAAKKFGFETLRNEHPERETVAQELEFFRAHSENIVGLGHNGVRGNPCLFPARFFPELLSLEGDVGGSAVIKRHLDDLLLFEAPETELRDVDTKEALEALKKR